MEFDRFYHRRTSGLPAKNVVLVNYPDPTTSRFGYVLQIHTGSEAGGALVDIVQKVSSGTAKITVSYYFIAPFVPQCTGNIQWIRASRLGLLEPEKWLSNLCCSLSRRE